nr:hypothetical protein [Tanacetum cinerariifolium]
MSSKAFRVFNKRTKRAEENLHVDFLENKLIKKGAGPNWLFNIDTLTNSMNYVPVVVAGTSSTNFLVYQMDVKSAFRYGTIDEEVYVMQPPGFQDLEFPDRVYKVEKLCREFEALMHDKFQMSTMGELNFFLGLQVLQKKDVIFLSQDKYVGDI